MRTPTCSVSSQQSYLDGDRRIVEQYGATLPSEWGGWAFEESEGRTTLVAFFTDRIAHHEDAIRSRVRFPDRLRLATSMLAFTERERIRDEIADRLEAAQIAPSAVSIDGDVIRVRLPRGAEAFADQLRRDYGARIDATVGYELRAPVRS